MTRLGSPAVRGGLSGKSHRAGTVVVLVSAVLIEAALMAATVGSGVQLIQALPGPIPTGRAESASPAALPRAPEPPSLAVLETWVRKLIETGIGTAVRPSPAVAP